MQLPSHFSSAVKTLAGGFHPDVGRQYSCTWFPCVRRDAKRSMGPQWRKVYEQNYHRSLDHRSFYFKQVDKRHLGAKGMLQVRWRGGGLSRFSRACEGPYVT